MIEFLKKQNLILGIGSIIILVCIIVFQFKGDSNTPLLLREVFVDPSTTINSINLIDHKNNPVTAKRLLNNWTFVSFGFTSCPDVCPATLSQLAQIDKKIKNKMGLGKNKSAQFFFVSVDPKRDSIKHLADYITLFDSSSKTRIFGMTGNVKSIKVFEEQLGAFHRIDNKSKKDNYNVQHSAEIFLIDPDGRLTAKFLPPMKIKRVVKQFELFVKRYSNRVI